MKKIPPFSNPTALYTNLDTRLTEAGLDKVQKRSFYLWFHIRKRVPNQSVTNSKLEEKEFREFVLSLMEGYERFKKVHADIEFGHRSFLRSTIINEGLTKKGKK